MLLDLVLFRSTWRSTPRLPCTIASTATRAFTTIRICSNIYAWSTSTNMWRKRRRPPRKAKEIYRLDPLRVCMRAWYLSLTSVPNYVVYWWRSSLLGSLLIIMVGWVFFLFKTFWLLIVNWVRFVFLAISGQFLIISLHKRRRIIGLNVRPRERPTTYIGIEFKWSTTNIVLLSEWLVCSWRGQLKSIDTI